jgi:hypothetical protein
VEDLRAGADQVVLSVVSADPPGSLPVQQWRQLAKAFISWPQAPEAASLLLELANGQADALTGPMVTMGAVAGDPVALKRP